MPKHDPKRRNYGIGQEIRHRSRFAVNARVMFTEEQLQCECIHACTENKCTIRCPERVAGRHYSMGWRLCVRCRPDDGTHMFTSRKWFAPHQWRVVHDYDVHYTELGAVAVHSHDNLGWSLCPMCRPSQSRTHQRHSCRFTPHQLRVLRGHGAHSLYNLELEDIFVSLTHPDPP